MNLKKVDSSVHEERIKYYQAKSLEELKKIVPKWACGDHVEKLLDMSIHPSNNEFKIYIVDIEELIAKTEFFKFSFSSLFTDEMLNDGRTARLLYHWENNGYVDPPNISISNLAEGKLSIGDGRHRTKLTKYLGYTTIPIAIHFSDIESVAKVIRLS